jgi:hypothetical protein
MASIACNDSGRNIYLEGIALYVLCKVNVNNAVYTIFTGLLEDE